MKKETAAFIEGEGLLCYGIRHRSRTGVPKSWKRAAIQLGISIADYVAHREAGDVWLSRQKRWQTKAERLALLTAEQPEE